MALQNQENEKNDSAILDAMMKVDQELEDQQASVNSNSDREAYSSSHDTGVSPSTEISNSRGTGAGQDDDSGTMSIAHTENKAVLLWKLVMILVLLTGAVGVAFTVFYYVSNDEEADFEAAFIANSRKVFEAIGDSLDVKLAAVDIFVTSIVSYAKDTNKTWPFVTLPHFAEKASKVRGLSHAMAITQMQVVWNDDDRRMWEDSYVQENEWWVQEGIDIQRSDPAFDGDISCPDYVPHGDTSIWYGDDVPFNDAPYIPTWQSYPVLSFGDNPPYNTNMIMSPKRGSAIKAAMELHEVTISRVLNKVDPDEPTSPFYVRAVNEWNARHVGTDGEAEEPLVQFLYPILVDNADTNQVKMNQLHPDNSTVVAIMATSFFWKAFLENTLPEGQRGINVVFENSCGQAFTYSLDGAETNYRGEGDRHNPRFDAMGETFSVSELVYSANGVATYTGLPLSNAYCPYSVSVYPSTTFESNYKSDNPIISL